MYRVGMLGTENSHALTFAKDICFNEEYKDFKITALYALEKEPSLDIIEKCNLTDVVIVDNPEDMMDLVDCVIVTNRHGKYHKECSLPFIKAGKPAFIDKPFTIDPDEAREILEVARKNNVPLSGGSGCKYAPALIDLAEMVKNDEFGRIYSGIMNFPAYTESEHGGLYFYASHLIEMVMAVYGVDIKAVSAFLKNEQITAIAHYDKYDITMSFAVSKKYVSVLYGEKDVDVRNIDISTIFVTEFKHFADMVRTGVSSMTEDELLVPVLVMNALEQSLAENRTVEVKR